MKTHHRIPSVFNLSMVDVLCCALGCVILLWLLNLLEAKEKAVEAGESNLLLAATRGQRDQLQEDQDRYRKQLAEQEQQIASLDKNLQTVSESAKDLETRLKKTEEELRASSERGEETKEKMLQAKERIKTLQPLADSVPDLKAEIKIFKQKLVSEEALTKVLQADLERGKQTLITVGKDLKGFQARRRKVEEDVADSEQALAAATSYHEQ